MSEIITLEIIGLVFFIILGYLAGWIIALIPVVVAVVFSVLDWLIFDA